MGKNMGGNKLSLEEDFWGEVLTSCYISYNTDFVPCWNEVLMDKIVFYFGQKALHITPLVDSDEIRITLNLEEQKEQSILPSFISKYIGKQLTSTWECINITDYFDVFMMAFTNLHPAILIFSEGSSLKLLEAGLVMSERNI
jgi:hypothetical protein